MCENIWRPRPMALLLVQSLLEGIWIGLSVQIMQQICLFTLQKCNILRNDLLEENRKTAFNKSQISQKIENCDWRPLSWRWHQFNTSGQIPRMWQFGWNQVLQANMFFLLFPPAGCLPLNIFCSSYKEGLFDQRSLLSVSSAGEADQNFERVLLWLLSDFGNDWKIPFSRAAMNSERGKQWREFQPASQRYKP